MKVIGIIEAGKMTKELVQYSCLKCGADVTLEFTIDMSENQKKYLLDLGHVCLCNTCSCDSKVEKLVDCLVH